MHGDDLYRDPDLYDLEYASQVEDVLFYARMASAAGGEVLELGCGTGRITLPIARTGATVTALDREPAMLDALRGRLSGEPTEVQRRVRCVQGDFCALREPARYRLVLLPFNALHHCADHHQVLALLAGVRRALRPGGRLALDCYLPDPILYARDPEQRHEERTFEHPRTGEILRSWETGHYDPLRQIHQVRYIYRYPDGREREVVLNLRVFYPQELRALLDWGGFDVVSEAEDFAGTPLDGTSLKCVMVLRPRR